MSTDTDNQQKFAQLVAHACIEAFEKEREQNSWRYIREAEAKDKLRSYRRLKKKISDGEEMPSEDEKAELRWKCLEDLIGKPDEYLDKTIRTIGSRERSIRETQYAVWQVDDAMRLYKDEVEKYGTDEDKRRYRVLCSMYTDPVRKSPREIAEEEKIAERTVYKDIDAAVSIVAVYMFGV